MLELICGTLLACLLGIVLGFTIVKDHLSQNAAIQLIAVFVVFIMAYMFQAKGLVLWFTAKDSYMAAIPPTLFEIFFFDLLTIRVLQDGVSGLLGMDITLHTKREIKAEENDVTR